MKQLSKQKEFSINQFLFGAACVVILFGITTVCLSAPLLDAMDKWMDNLRHQIYTTVAILLIVVIYWIVWRVRK